MSRVKRRASNWGASFGALFLGTMASLTRRLPRRISRGIGSACGRAFLYLAPAMRRGLDKNLRELLCVSHTDLPAMRRDVFQNFGLTLHDFFLGDDITIDVPNRKILEDLRATHKKGVLVLTFHMGHWELGARTMRQWGWPVTAVYQPYRNPHFKRLIESRRAPGVNFLPVGGAAANGVREALRRGDIVAMLGDLPFGEEGTVVSLLGRHVLWPKGPVLLAVRENTPIVVAVIVRKAPARYEAIIEEPLFPQSRNRAEVERLVAAVADKFGKLLVRYPTQWFRFRPLEFVNPARKTALRSHRSM